MRWVRPATLILVGAACVQTLFAWLVLAQLGAPLLWEDEGETAMHGRSVLEHGYPKVHTARGNIVYGVHHPLELGVYEPLDAYLGSPWAQYYFAAPAVAWSDAARDLAERTRRVRLPFALAGWLGVMLLGSAAASLWPAAAGGRARFWLVFGVCLVLSVSLQLHLREARYYPLVVLGVAGVIWLETRRFARGNAALAPALLLALVLWCLFNSFYPAFAAVAVVATGALALRALRSRAPAPARALELARGAAPYLLVSAAALPLAVFYRILPQSRSFAATFGGPHNDLGSRLASAAWYLLRFELAVPAVVGAVAFALALRRAGPADRDLRRLAGTGRLLLAGAAIWVAIVAATPLFFERYLVPLSPLLGVSTALSVGGLLALRRTGARRSALAGLAAIAVAMAGAAVVRIPELHGRWTELREPYRGPLDHVIPYLAERYPDPSQLVIATNYEDFSYMFYLGALTTFGYYAPERERDLAITPDVVIPRPWPRNLRALEYLAADGDYVAREFPVANVPANNLPELSPLNQSGLVHRFTSPVVGRDGGALVIGERSR